MRQNLLNYGSRKGIGFRTVDPDAQNAGVMVSQILSSVAKSKAMQQNSVSIRSRVESLQRQVQEEKLDKYVPTNDLCQWLFVNNLLKEK